MILPSALLGSSFFPNAENTRALTAAGIRSMCVLACSLGHQIPSAPEHVEMLRRRFNNATTTRGRLSGPRSSLLKSCIDPSSL
jgi:hypothetical protein